MPYQIVYRKKPRETTYIRKLPETVEKPTKFQILERIHFGQLSSMLKEFGKLHPIERATILGELMKGKYFGRTVKPKKWQIEYKKELEKIIKEAEKLLAKKI